MSNKQPEYIIWKGMKQPKPPPLPTLEDAQDVIDFIKRQTEARSGISEAYVMEIAQGLRRCVEEIERLKVKRE